MPWFKRARNTFRRDELAKELDEELASHLEEAIEQGRDPEEARRAFGRMLRHRESSQDVKLRPWFESLRADLVFGWRQLWKHRSANVSAILSLALAMGAITGVFRIVEAVLLRPLPVASPELLQSVEVASPNRDGSVRVSDDFSYPMLTSYREVLADDADLLLVGGSVPTDVTYKSDDDIEKLYRQYVSGNLSTVFGLKPALGRLLLPSDDNAPGAHAVAVLSYDYWTRRFARDPNVIGKTFRMGPDLFEIIGVGPEGFIGTEPGAIADAFIPATMHVQALDSPGWSWFRIWMRPKPGVSLEQIRQKLEASIVRERRESAGGWVIQKDDLDRILNVHVLFRPAANGTSELQRQYREPLVILSILALLVLIIACANVANLRTAQAVARGREMALRVSIGAGRRRLIQMVLVESFLSAMAASILGVLFAWFSVPLVISMLTPPEEPVRLVLAPDFRIAAFVMGVTIVITFLCGLTPAVRASSVSPLHSLKGGEIPLANRRLTNSLLTAQVAFCVLVLFTGVLLVTTFRRLTTQYLGFRAENVAVLEVGVTTGKQSPQVWSQVTDRLEEMPEVQSASLAGWPLMSGNRWTVAFEKDGRLMDQESLALDVSPNFFETMNIGWIDGRRFRPNDRAPHLGEDEKPVPGVGIVNEAFARTFFDGRNPIGQTMHVFVGKTAVAPVEIVGYVRDARYEQPRANIRPTLFVPGKDRDYGMLLVRTATDVPAVAGALRTQVGKTRSDFKVRNVTTQMGIVRRHSITERLLATLSLFFTATALMLAGMGLYSVLSYAIIRRRKEIGIRRALGAQAASIVQRVAVECAVPLLMGSAIGIAAGLACERYLRFLLFEVKATDPDVLALPAALMAIVAVIAAVQPTLHALGIDPAETLRSE